MKVDSTTILPLIGCAVERAAEELVGADIVAPAKNVQLAALRLILTLAMEGLVIGSNIEQAQAILDSFKQKV